MTKWICNKKECELAPCKIEMDFKNVPKCCPAMIGFFSEWKKDEPVTDCNQLATNCSQLPDWCKVGEWVWLDPQKITGANGYEKITNVDGLGLMFESGLMVCFSHRILQARLRPYNAEEMKALVGKVIEHKKDLHLVTNYLNDTADNEPIVRVGTNWRDAKGLIEHNYTIDGKPCGVLEYLKDEERKA